MHDTSTKGIESRDPRVEVVQVRALWYIYKPFHLPPLSVVNITFISFPHSFVCVVAIQVSISKVEVVLVVQNV